MMGVVWSLLGILSGAFIAIQAPINSQLARGLGLPVAAAAFSFLSGAVVLGIISVMVVKLQGTELRHELERLAIDVMGENGLAYGANPYLRDRGSWQYAYMFYLGLIIGGGTSQIQKNIIAERGLGLPREPKLQVS